jgi:hypothetical protein
MGEVVVISGERMNPVIANMKGTSSSADSSMPQNRPICVPSTDRSPRPPTARNRSARALPVRDIPVRSLSVATVGQSQGHGNGFR